MEFISSIFFLKRSFYCSDFEASLSAVKYICIVVSVLRAGMSLSTEKKMIKYVVFKLRKKTINYFCFQKLYKVKKK